MGWWYRDRTTLLSPRTFASRPPQLREGSMTSRIQFGMVLLGVAALGCGGDSGSRSDPAKPAAQGSATSGSAALTGAGATFPTPIYTKWFDAYAKETGVRI